MDLEKLTKHQIILLALLVSFVSSVATGIVTASLMSQAPPSVTHTINQIVERTVETVSSPTQPAAVATKTVVFQSDDLATQSIATVQKSIIRIVAQGGSDLIARGVIVTQSGEAFTDSGALANSGATAFDALLSDGTRVPLTLPQVISTTSPIVAVSVAVGTSTAWTPAPLADQSKLVLGESVIRIGGIGEDLVGEGVIAALPQAGSADFQASVQSTTPGSLIMDVYGNVIGLATSESIAEGSTYYTLLPSLATSTPATNPST